MDPSSVITQVSAAANAENVNNDTSSSSQGGPPASTTAAAPAGASIASSQLQTSSKGTFYAEYVELASFFINTAESIHVHLEVISN